MRDDIPLTSRRRRGSEARDRGFAKRLLLALAASIAVHEVLAGLWPSRKPAEPAERVVAQVVTIVRRPPKPRARPTPVPTPRITPAPHYTLAPQIVVRAPAPKAAATPHASLGGAAAPRRARHAVPRLVAARSAAGSTVAGTHAGLQNGGAGTGAGPGTGDGGLGGTGSGTDDEGNGNGGDANTAPCGDIFILPGAVVYRPDGSVLQGALVKIVLRDGTVDVAKFPYPFVYPRKAANPFLPDAQLSQSGGIPVQMPPPGSDVTTMPPAVQVVLKHTDPATGYTDLPGCNAETPP